MKYVSCKQIFNFKILWEINLHKIENENNFAHFYLMLWGMQECCCWQLAVAVVGQLLLSCCTSSCCQHQLLAKCWTLMTWTLEHWPHWQHCDQPDYQHCQHPEHRIVNPDQTQVSLNILNFKFQLQKYDVSNEN